MTAPDLLNCPFCGGPATHAKTLKGWKVECEGRMGSCTMNARTHYQPTKWNAYDAWNTRAPLAEALAVPTEKPDMPAHLVEYTNYRGETARRVIIPIRMWWGSTEWHTEDQWVLTAWDCEKNAVRDFAWQDMRPVQNGATSAALRAIGEPRNG